MLAEQGYSSPQINPSATPANGYLPLAMDRVPRSSARDPLKGHDLIEADDDCGSGFFKTMCAACVYTL